MAVRNTLGAARWSPERLSIDPKPTKPSEPLRSQRGHAELAATNDWRRYPSAKSSQLVTMNGYKLLHCVTGATDPLLANGA